MDKDTIILYAKKLKLAIFVLVVGLSVFVFGIKCFIPKVKDFIKVNQDIKTQTQSIEENTKKLSELKSSMKSKEEQQTSLLKEFYKPIEGGLDAESVMSEEFGDVLNMIRANSIKTRAVKYDYNPSTDKFVKNASNKYNVCTVNLEMIADYKHFQAFLRDLYKHEHFLEISDIEIIPYEKDKKILLIKSNLKLYAQKSETESSTAKPPSTQPSPDMGADAVRVNEGTPPRPERRQPPSSGEDSILN